MGQPSSLCFDVLSDTNKISGLLKSYLLIVRKSKYTVILQNMHDGTMIVMQVAYAEPLKMRMQEEILLTTLLPI